MGRAFVSAQYTRVVTVCPERSEQARPTHRTQLCAQPWQQALDLRVSFSVEVTVQRSKERACDVDPTRGCVVHSSTSDTLPFPLTLTSCTHGCAEKRPPASKCVVAACMPAKSSCITGNQSCIASPSRRAVSAFTRPVSIVAVSRNHRA